MKSISFFSVESLTLLGRDENGLLNYYTMHQNCQNLVQKWWWSVAIFRTKFSSAIGRYFKKQNCRIWGSENPHVIEDRPLHPEKVTVWCILWSEGMIGRDTAQYVSKSGRKYLKHLAWRSFKWCSISRIMSTFKLYN